MDARHASIVTLLGLAALPSLAAAQCNEQVSLVIQGTHNPYLAGQPPGTTSKSDTAPQASPFLLPLALADGDVLRFTNVSGDVWNLPGGGGPGPDGWTGNDFDVTPDLGVSGYLMPENCLLGVFLTDQTNAGPAPPKLDFSSSGSKDQAVYTPELFQTFFIGDGLRLDGVTVQSWRVPPGATRLFLGSADGWNWSDNSGTFQFDVTRIPAASACADVESISAFLGGTQTITFGAGPANAGLFYLFLGTVSGTSPGFPFDDFVLPLNYDAYTGVTLKLANKGPWQNTLGVLDGSGGTTASIVVPAGLDSSLVGTTFHHAALVFEVLPTTAGLTFVSNAVPLTLEP